jgi:peptide/nickel transport system substrate-binding protein
VVKLNANAKWTDGKPVTADDVMFSLEMITHPEYSSLLASQMVPLEGLDPGGKRTMDMADFPGARKVDEHTIEFKTKNPLALDVFHEKIAGNLKALPKHVLKDADPSKLNQHPFMQEPTVSYGSFMFVRYQKDQFVELKANPDFFLGAPKLDKLYFKIVSPANLVAQLESGDIDMNYPDIGPIPVEDYQRVQNLPHIEATQGQPVNYKFMGFNTERLSDKRIRQAIAYGINRELLVNNLLQGFGEVGNGPYSPAHPYYKEALNGTYPYDPERAKQLLAEANWKANQPLVLIVPANQGLERIGDIIVNNLQEIGVTVKAELMDTPAAIQRLLKGDFDLWLLTNTFLLDPDQYNFYATGMPNNFSRISHSDIDELLKKGLEVADEAERKEIYGRYQEVFNEEMPALQLFADYRLRAVNKRVIVGGPKDIGMLNHVHEWDVEQ